MKFKLVHNCINVLDLDRSLKFYEEALGLKEARRSVHPDGDYILSFIENEESTHQVELTWLRDRTEPYNLGDNEFHIAFETEEFEAALEKHKAMGVVCFENAHHGIYFIEDPDGYWLEIVPAK